MIRRIDWEYFGLALEQTYVSRNTPRLSFSLGLEFDRWNLRVFVTGFKYVASVRLGVVD